ncbi:hypothetical protein [Sphingomonas asaccharolytica]|uniref:hypothetical protein n=1 Tax=Sphingomonas asaccharolytica TaxID=40681 RepID=UPI001C3F95FD|nr:hypothetical protein [Sphingomonas asaccharolytica]
MAKQFSDRDRDAYRVETFDYIAHYFENSIAELDQRNPGIQGQFRRIDANRFTATAYRHGQSVARCSVFMGGTSFSSGIAYSNSDDGGSNSFNENLTVQSDDQSMYLKSMGMASYMRQRDEKLTQEGAAELFWEMFIAPLQRG